MKNSSLALMLLITLFAFGCESQTIDDAAITTEVKSKLAADGNTSALKIGVETTDGVVNLSGTVPTDMEKKKAEEIARNVDGVTNVVNKISVDPDSMGATNAEERLRETGETVGEAISDATILTKIKSKLLAESILGTNVDVSEGNVVIKGEVENAQEKKTAEEIARKTDGVKSVKNELTVKGYTVRGRR